MFCYMASNGYFYGALFHPQHLSPIPGITLDATTKSVTWNLNTDSKEYPSPFYKLVIRQILLGHQAKDNEFNVVEVSDRRSDFSITSEP